MSERRAQLRYSSLHDLCNLSSRDNNVKQCLCCLRFISKSGPSTVKIEVGPATFCRLVDDNKQTCPELYYRQVAQVHQDNMYVCFICEPNIKKALKQMDANEEIQSPSKFLVETLQCIEQGVFTFKNFFPIFKGVVCLASELQTPSACHRHPLRCVQMDTTEGVITFVRMMAIHNNNDDDSSTERLVWSDFKHGDDFESRARKTPPIEEIIAMIRWQHRGSGTDPLSLSMTSYEDCCEETSSLRRCMRNSECKHVFRLIHGQQRDVEAEDRCIFCAGCCDDIAKYQREEVESFETAVLLSWHELTPYFEHTASQSQEAASPPFTLRCTRTNKIQLRSYEYYKNVLCKSIPKEYHYASPRHFYSSQLFRHKSVKTV